MGYRIIEHNMTSIIKVNTFQDTNGNALFNSDGSGNVTLSAGAMKNTPAFLCLCRFWTIIFKQYNDISSIQYRTIRH